MNFLSWNVHGLGSSIGASFCKLLNGCDICALYETWAKSDDDFNDFLPGYHKFAKSWTKVTDHGHHPGGILVCVKDSLAPGVKRIKETFKYAITLLLDGDFFGLGQDMLLFCVYLPPQGSTSYEEDQENGVDLLENHIAATLADQDGECSLCILGDLNARTGALRDYVVDDGAAHLPIQDWYPESDFSVPRNSRDAETEPNSFGRSLIQLCHALDIHMLNGRSPQDPDGEFTFVSDSGCSLVDYVLVQPEYYHQIIDFRVDKEDDSDHYPLLFSIPSVKLVSNNSSTYQSEPRTKFTWRPEKAPLFTQRIVDAVSTEFMDTFYLHVAEDRIDLAVDSLVEMYSYAAVEMKQVSTGIKKDSRNNFQGWDQECDEEKKKKINLLNIFRRTRSPSDLENYLRAKKDFKNLCKQKKEYFQCQMREKLKNSMVDVKACWNVIKSFKRSKPENSISPEEWTAYFSNLLNKPSNRDVTFEARIDESISNHDQGNCVLCQTNDPVDLNSEIITEEVINAIKDMPSKKAPGLDGLCIELFKHSTDIAVPMLLALFNRILSTGQFPASWSHALLLPLHKKGSYSDPNNYRGISLLSVVSKIFTKILCTRLTAWAEGSGLLYEEQAGFRKGRSTVDQIFALQAVTQKYLSRRRGRFYVIFVDFSKAFDTISHKHLWHRLMNIGVHGNFLNVLRAMYSQLKTSVLTAAGVSSAFVSSMGTRQGCLLSPLLFILYLNGLSDLCHSLGCQGVYISEEFPNVLSLLYADDLADCADTPGRLQKVIDAIVQYSQLWGLQVNIDKTKIIVFRNGGILRSNEKWFMNGQKLETVTSYKYLGLMFTSRLCWTLAQQTLASQALKAVQLLKCISYKCKGLPPKTLLMLFDKMIVPVLTYGSEIWGYQTRIEIERVQTKYCRFILGVGSSAPVEAVLGDCGRVPIGVSTRVRCIKYWLKILSMEDTRIPRACYNMLYEHEQAGRTNWASEIKNLLCSHGFGFVWFQQGVGNVHAFLLEFENRVRDCASQLWLSDIRANQRLELYYNCKSQLEPEKYLFCIEHNRYIHALARVRVSNHALLIEKGRHLHIDRDSRWCPYCLKHGRHIVETEYHFVLICDQYVELRKKHIAKYYWNNPSYHKFVLLLQSDKITTLNELAEYIYSAMKVRKVELCQVESV